MVKNAQVYVTSQIFQRLALWGKNFFSSPPGSLVTKAARVSNATSLITIETHHFIIDFTLNYLASPSKSISLLREIEDRR